MQALKKLDSEIDPETKNLIINGDRAHLAMALRQLHDLYEGQEPDCEDSLETEEFKKVRNERTEQPEPMKESLSLSKSEEQPALVPFGKKNSEQLAAL